MKLYNLLSGIPPIDQCALGLGTFDGVHKGHQTLILKMMEHAKRDNMPAVIFTFDHPPRRILEPNNFPGEITTPEEKFTLLLSSGVDAVVFRPFDEEFAHISPERFIEEILIEKLNAKRVFVGFNFGFGQNRRGNAEFLQKELCAQGRECIVIPPVKIDDYIVSSTLIRKSISEGNIELASKLLGRSPIISGEVVHGDKRGREMGFPTANIPLENSLKVLPPRGVYHCIAETESGCYYAIVNIGVRPTFNRNLLLLEAHLLDFHGNLYNTNIRIKFLQRLRNEIKFPSTAALIEQIKADIAVARALRTQKSNIEKSLHLC